MSFVRRPILEALFARLRDSYGWAFAGWYMPDVSSQPGPGLALIEGDQTPDQRGSRVPLWNLTLDAYVWRTGQAMPDGPSLLNELIDAIDEALDPGSEEQPSGDAWTTTLAGLVVSVEIGTVQMLSGPNLIEMARIPLTVTVSA